MTGLERIMAALRGEQPDKVPIMLHNFMTAALIEVFSDTPRFVLNAGCAIPPNAPPENIKAMIGTARA